jgi:hypothetical protein
VPRAPPVYSSELTSNAESHRPYVLWSDTLPSGETAKLLIWPQEHQASAILHLAGSVHSAHICTSRQLAVEKGLKLREQVRKGELPLPDVRPDSTSAG